MEAVSTLDQLQLGSWVGVRQGWDVMGSNGSLPFSGLSFNHVGGRKNQRDLSQASRDSVHSSHFTLGPPSAGDFPRWWHELRQEWFSNCREPTPQATGESGDLTHLFKEMT